MKLIPIIAVVLYMFVSSISDAKKRQRRIREAENEIEEDQTEVECEEENTHTTQTHDRLESLLKQLTGQASVPCGTASNGKCSPAHSRRQDDKTDGDAAQVGRGLCERQNGRDENSANSTPAHIAQMPAYSLQNGNTTAQGDDGRDSETYSLQNGNTAATDKTRAATKSERETESTEESEHTLSQEFDLRRAVLYSEILKPKFDNFQD
ncbi:MAG: hypothetical protein J6K38_05320 [Alistipes sp.]|nr:hypothetical protein [Alistipes sp.]